MSDAVAIVSVASSAAIGFSGIVAGLYGASRARVWQAQSDRATDLRALLDTTNLEPVLQRLFRAHDHGKSLLAEPDKSANEPESDDEASEVLEKRTIKDMEEALDAAIELRTVSDRIRLRQGSDSKTAAALSDFVNVIADMRRAIRSELADRQPYAAFDEDMKKARAKAKDFYDASASDLRSRNI
jgi:hypothetical protein